MAMSSFSINNEVAINTAFEKTTIAYDLLRERSNGAFSFGSSVLSGNLVTSQLFTEGASGVAVNGSTAPVLNDFTASASTGAITNRQIRYAVSVAEAQRVGYSEDDVSRQFGSAVAQGLVKTNMSDCIASLVGTAGNSSHGMVVDISGETDGKMSYEAMLRMMELYGDMYGDIACYVMHSAKWFELLKGLSANTTLERILGGVGVGLIPTTTIPILVVDDAKLKVTGGSPDPYYRSFAIRENGVISDESSNPFISSVASHQVSGSDNTPTLDLLYQTRFSYTVNGYVYGGAANIDAAGLATTSNWTLNKAKKLTGAAMCKSK